MTDTPNHYEAVLADIDAKIAKLQAARESIVELMAMSGATPSGGGPAGKIAHDAFLQMSIPEATKKYLGVARQKKNTQAIIDALEQGGLPRSEYSTVYAVLRRREKQVGDIINIKGDWALAEWYPNYKRGGPVKELTEADLEEVTKEADKVATEISGKSAKAS